MIIEGIVEQGKHLGRLLGFPTANVAPLRWKGRWPTNGVYAAALWLDGDLRAWPGMLNQGVHPTVPEGKPTIEIHLPGFQGDLYGLPVRVEYLHFLRPECRFESLSALKAQLVLDREAVLNWLRAALAGDACKTAADRVQKIAWHME